ncbi:acyl carrier protein [Streptomyces sp. NPDC018045]|uniref:acyl carrier protein n=1 Tax=Streptomyces sp. NPDC018045 TaxID=3365037 RepID=UPI00378FE24D
MTASIRTGEGTAGIKQEIDAIARTVLEREAVDPAVDLFDQGATSLAFIRIVAQVNEKYDIAVDVTALDEASVDSLSALAQAHITSQEPLTLRD